MGRQFTTWCTIACLIGLAILQPCFSDSPDARFVDGLRQRRLFELAEAYCNDRLARTTPTDAAQVELTLELIRTFALHGADTPLGERDALWTKARTTAATFLKQSPPHPRAILISVQD